MYASATQGGHNYLITVSTSLKCDTYHKVHRNNAVIYNTLTYKLIKL